MRESWKDNKSKWEIWKVNLAQKRREFNQKTHGMGTLIIIMITGLLIFGTMQLIGNIITANGHLHIDQTITVNACFSGHWCLQPV